MLQFQYLHHDNKRYIMKIVILLILFLVPLSADWTTDIKEKSIVAYNKTLTIFADKNLTISQKRQEHFNKIWKDLFKEIEKGAKLEEALISAPEDAWITTDKKDIRHDIDKTINGIIEYLSQDELLSYKELIASLKKDIKRRKENILSYREQKIGAPTTSTLYTTIDGYDTKIKEDKDNINVY